MKPQHLIVVLGILSQASFSVAQQSSKQYGSGAGPGMQKPPTLAELASHLLSDPVTLVKIGVTEDQLSMASLRKSFRAYYAGYLAATEPERLYSGNYRDFISNEIIPWKSLTPDQQVALRRIVVTKFPNGALQLLEVQSRLNLSADQCNDLWRLYQRKSLEFAKKAAPAVANAPVDLSWPDPVAGEPPSPEKMDQFADKLTAQFHLMPKRWSEPDTVWPELKAILTPAQWTQYQTLSKTL
jgi:hypothetical protein